MNLEELMYFLSTPIEELQLPLNCSNPLRRFGADTIGQLLRALERDSELKSIRTIGEKKCEDIKEKLNNYIKDFFN